MYFDNKKLKKLKYSISQFNHELMVQLTGVVTNLIYLFLHFQILNIFFVLFDVNKRLVNVAVHKTQSN